MWHPHSRVKVSADVILFCSGVLRRRGVCQQGGYLSSILSFLSESKAHHKNKDNLFFVFNLSYFCVILPSETINFKYHYQTRTRKT